ncbi:MAG TPA: dihydroorotate dehydrogenase electron transfer subunit [Syntrophomonas sp.]|nr:dihydroorotate dehydrogenase electron transfer subunit [Syntrophomonas sp.]
MATLEQGTVISNRPCAPALFEMEIEAPRTALLCEPGQFLQVRASAGLDPLLRRPISIYDVDRQGGIITLLYKVVGRGTELLAGLRPQHALDIMGPLGRGFTLPPAPGRAVLVGGGVGIAPLLYLARRLREMQWSLTVCYGAGSAKELAAASRFDELGVELLLATADGSRGYKGLVTELLQAGIMVEKIDMIYTCGPEIMMAAVTDFAARYGLQGECSLEEHMACGVGACLGCARKLKNSDQNYGKVCKDGPVFSLAAVELGRGGLV